MELQLKQVGEWESNKRTKRRIAEVFVEQPDRPINQGDILGDFAWRRSHKAPVSNKQVRAFMAAQLGLAEDAIKVGYSKYCGCSMCPCSPGYVVSMADGHAPSKKSFWLEMKS